MARGRHGLTPRLTRGFFDKVGRDWDAAWAKKVTPWELQAVNPSFAEGLAHVPLPPGGRALVPGCGSGYDILHLHQKGWVATGLDISATAVAQAQSVVPPGLVRVADFFEFESPTPFDLIYDYLFFAAIEPEMRIRAAEQFHALLRPDSGTLMTLLFPCVPEAIKGKRSGPPYELSLQEYVEVFEAAGLRLCSTLVPSTTIKPRRGRELLAYWDRR
ncbi:thiocyanate methyltransferase 1-like [Achlya hypogyna]|uniref:Thiocyanate methyltransferase 1-like n=1 Tax=Achlya hypogyna TaxID=1202772 RepID=A0A1V9ZRZ2_ACHHY|nr:thiocyanate methyltransferase 1-like [Achlya hypogyna]